MGWATQAQSLGHGRLWVSLSRVAPFSACRGVDLEMEVEMPPKTLERWRTQRTPIPAMSKPHRASRGPPQPSEPSAHTCTPGLTMARGVALSVEKEFTEAWRKR